MDQARTFIDHLGRSVQVRAQPQRIISLCPSQTSTLFALGLGSRIAGRTHFCIHPKPAIEAVPAVGGTKNLKHERVEAIQPDLVIAEKEENTPEMVAWLAERYPVFVTDVRDFASALRMVRDFGALTGQVQQAETLASQIETAISHLKPLPQPLDALYFIWRKPWMLASADTYIDAVLQHWGLRNLAHGLPGRYPELDAAAIASLKPQVILLSSEPFPFIEKHQQEVQKLFPAAKVLLVDGEMFSWYGDRMLELGEYLEELSAYLVEK